MMDDTKSLSDVGFTSGTARAQSPAEIGGVFLTTGVARCHEAGTRDQRT